MKKYTSDFTFKAEDDWGDFYKGNYRKPWFNKLGYSCKNYKDNNGNWFFMEEHRATNGLLYHCSPFSIN